MGRAIRVYSGLDKIPRGRTSGKVTQGTLLIEGGAWRGLYAQGAVDALMEEDITFRTTIGVSAGAMAGMGYVAGQIGWEARLNLAHRNDPDYVGIGAWKRDAGITGFSYLFNDLARKEEPLDRERFFGKERRFIAVATDIRKGKPVYFEKGKCRILLAVRASATVPYLSRPVMIDGVPYLDGSYSVHIPYRWAQEYFPGKLIVIRTRDRSYRAKEKKITALDRMMYGEYPAFLKSMVHSERDYDQTLDQLDLDEAERKVFVLAPDSPIKMGHFESDPEVLGALYWRGYRDMKERIPELKAYLEE